MAYARQDCNGDYLYEGDKVSYDAAKKGFIEATVTSFVDMDKSRLILKTNDEQIIKGYCDRCEKVK